MNHSCLCALLLASAAGTALALAQEGGRDAYVAPGHAQALPEDVESLDAILSAVYDVVSGPAGARDWDRLESLFYPEFGRLMPCADGPAGAVVENLTPRDYQAHTGAFFAENAFYETEVARTVERFGHIAHAFSTYETRSTPDAEPFRRGINSIQLFHDGERWWVLSIVWDAETPAQPIPAEYLK